MRATALLAAATFAAATFAAHADAYTVSTNTGAFNATSTPQSTSISIAQFNPALGTLDSITFSLAGQYQTTKTENNAEFDVLTSGSQDLTGQISDTEPDAGTYSVSTSQATTYGPLLSQFTGAGDVGVVFSFQAEAFLGNGNGNATNVTPGGLTFSATYNYTPAAPPPTTVTPEPTSLTLLGTGLLATVGVLRRHLA